MKKYKVTIIWVLVAVIMFAGGWYIGKNTASAGVTGGRGGFGAFASSTRGAFAGRGSVAGGGFVAGTVTAIDASSITLQLPNGNSENVFYSSSTSVIVPQAASISSVQPGIAVMIGGTQNPDGSLTASSIQVRNASGGIGR